jgi:hypothetical protein
MSEEPDYSYYDYDPADQPGAAELPDFEELWEEAMREHFEEEEFWIGFWEGFY